MTQTASMLQGATSAGEQAVDTAVPVDAVPNVLNTILVAVVFAAALFLMVLASRLTAWWQVLAVGVVFSYLLLTNYALLHEATHDHLHSHPRLNYLLGVVTGLLFPIPFSLVHTTHQNHHARNRTDSEMFDLYYPTDSRLRKYAQWYSILLGLFWPLAPLASLGLALSPRPLRELIIVGTQATGGYLMGEVRDKIAAIRCEVILIAAFFTALSLLLDLRWQAMLVLYACFSFNWSTRQYIGHAFTRRHVIEGAYNLKHNWLMSWILLHGEFDLNHHRRPDVSWIHLPRLSPPGENRPSYLRQYWRQWLGPRPNTEAPPQPLPRHSPAA